MYGGPTRKKIHKELGGKKTEDFICPPFPAFDI